MALLIAAPNREIEVEMADRWNRLFGGEGVRGQLENDEVH
jgi:hypothetical protein